MRAQANNPVDGTEIAYEVDGEGPPLVLVHGSGLSRGTWRGLGYLRDLQRDFTVVALDMRGHGKSGKPHDPASYTMDLHRGDVEAVLTATGLEPAHYVGYSFGARIGLSIAAHTPRLLRTLTTIGGSWAPMNGNIGATFAPDWHEALTTGGMARFVDRWGETIGRPIDPETRLAFMQDDPEALAAFFTAAETGGGLTVDQLDSVTVPTLLLAGTRDVDRHRESQEAARRMPAAAFYSLVGQDHASSLLPVDQVTDLLRTYLEAVDA
ncbi:alpha/beta hydrolase [Frigoribacterium faeni]|uniref:alpha/beta fold hydrolase n=1 Tax=Frigoribacterium faeni TaxID=145483 RepID=UPI001FAE0499|nr:alpha/beta hydrolase [Frigoribacterium faeni]MCJ0701926.1 alpha/beta hydrolase [Frigoribacterium faeni]